MGWLKKKQKGSKGSNKGSHKSPTFETCARGRTAVQLVRPVPESFDTYFLTGKHNSLIEILDKETDEEESTTDSDEGIEGIEIESDEIKVNDLDEESFKLPSDSKSKDSLESSRTMLEDDDDNSSMI